MRSIFHYLEADDPYTLIEEDIRRLERADKKLNIFITRHEYNPIETSGLILKPLNGMPIPIKDNISTKGIRTTCGSRILSNYIPPYDAHTVEILRDLGGYIAGKTNMDEFAMGSTSETGFTGPVKNPWNSSHVAGGSSGGSAVAVAVAGGVSLGSDTGGSVRLPAAYNYVLGLKPTYGLISRYGLISYADSLEQIGIFTRFPRDMAYILYHLSRYDGRDGTMYIGGEREDLRNRLIDIYHGEGYKADKEITIGISREVIDLSTEDVTRNTWKAIEKLEEKGVRIKEIDLDYFTIGLPTYYIIAMAEASSNLMRYDGILYGDLRWIGDYWRSVATTRAEGFGEEVKRRIVLGGLITSSGFKGRYYIRALKVRRWIRDKLISSLNHVDAILVPTSPTLPPKLGELEGVDAYTLDLYTVIPNLTGHPSINIPSGFAKGLPTGIQLISRYFTEDVLIHLADLLSGDLYDPYKEVDL